MRAAAAPERSRDGFRGYFYESGRPGKTCMVVVLGDEGNDFMSKAFARWLTEKQGIHALCVALRQEEGDTGVHSWSLEYLERAAQWLRKRGMERIGVLGMSMQGTMALSAAARIPDFSLTMAFAPSDFVPWGFRQGKMANGKKGEYPSGTSTFTWRGEELPWQPAFQDEEEYWKRFDSDTKQFHEPHSRGVFEYSERARAIPEECFVPVENCSGPVVLIGAEDDSMWDSARYIRRLEGRLREKNFAHPVEVFLYEKGTHLLVPEDLLRMALPLVGGIVPRFFASGRRDPKACKTARRDLEEKLSALLRRWSA